MLNNNPLTKLYEAMGRCCTMMDIIHCHAVSATTESFVASMVIQSGEGGLPTPTKRKKIERLANEFVVWWSMQVHQ